MDDSSMDRILPILEQELTKHEIPIVTLLADAHRDPFEILISTLLSLRTKDQVTAAATKRLFALASTPAQMVRLPEAQIARVIYPVGFYRNKARTIRQVCQDLIDRFDAKVPETLEALLTLKGVGRKTANLVVSLGFNGPGLCVDTHVHRISNRLGYVRTKDPEETEFALKAKLPRKYWLRYNTLLVAFGQTTCRPISPLCSTCPIGGDCDRVGVTRSR